MPRINFEYYVAQKRKDLLVSRIKAMKQKVAAEAIGVSQSRLSQKIKDGKCNFTYDELVKLFKDKRNFTDDEIMMIMGRKEIKNAES